MCDMVLRLYINHEREATRNTVTSELADPHNTMKIEVLMFVIGVFAARGDTTSTSDILKDTDVDFIYQTHLAVIEKHNITAPYHYRYGYECFNETTRESSGQFEIRYMDLAVGTYFRTSKGSNFIKTVEYTVDTPHGYRPTLITTPQDHASRHGYARLSGPIAYVSASAPPDTPMTLITKDTYISPEAWSAYETHGNVMRHLKLRAPYDITWGYQLKEQETGRVRSQYEEYKGVEGHGRFVFLEEDGTQSSITTKVNATGFYATMPEIQPNPVPPPVV